MANQALDIATKAMQGILKAPLRTGLSLFDVPRTFAGKNPTRSFQAPLLGKVESHQRQAVDMVNSDSSVPEAVLRSGSEAILDTALTGGMVSAISKLFSHGATQGASTFHPDFQGIKQNIGNTGKQFEMIQKSVKAGEIPSSSVFQGNGKLTLKYAQGSVDDIAQKLEFFKEGLGEVFKKSIDPSNTTMEQILKTAEHAIEVGRASIR